MLIVRFWIVVFMDGWMDGGLCLWMDGRIVVFKDGWMDEMFLLSNYPGPEDCSRM